MCKKVSELKARAPLHGYSAGLIWTDRVKAPIAPGLDYQAMRPMATERHKGKTYLQKWQGSQRLPSHTWNVWEYAKKENENL